MTEPININGQWTFTLVYGPEYQINEGQQLFCDANFIQHKNSFTGTCFDTTGFGANPEVANIKGIVTDDKITFIKRYAKLHYVDEHGNSFVHKTKAGPQIRYTGNYNKANNTFNGQWHITQYYFSFRTGFVKHTATGTFTMQRKTISLTSYNPN